MTSAADHAEPALPALGVTVAGTLIVPDDAVLFDIQVLDESAVVP